MSIARWISGRAELSPDRVAIHYESSTTSYADLDRRIGELAAALSAAGVVAADRVAILEYNTPDYIALLFACARLGATLVPLNWRLTPTEHAWQINDCTPRVMIAGAEFLDHCDTLRENVEIQTWIATDASRAGWTSLDDVVASDAELPDDVGTPASAAMLVYTSGTTGFPKGAVLTQSALLWSCINSQQVHQMTSADRVLTDLPLFHVGGINIQTLPALHAGASVILHNRFDPDRAFDSIEQLRPTLHLGVPPTLSALIAHPRWSSADLSSIRLLVAGSTVVPLNIIDAWFDRGIPVGQVYGSTETGPLVIALDGEHADKKRGSCGKPPIHCEARIVDADGNELPDGESGEIAVRGPNLFSGYWKNEAATADAMIGDWFLTGDVGHVDEDGFFFVDDRKKDVVISGGENVYPAEVENALGVVDGVREYAVVGKAHERWGEVPVLVVALDEGASLDAPSVTALLGDKLARYKIPREVIAIDALPRNAMGKVLKFKLREWLAENSGPSSD